jgi:hypothetical protein
MGQLIPQLWEGAARAPLYRYEPLFIAG